MIEMWFTANSFKKAYEILLKESLQEKNLLDSNTTLYVTSIVNGMFAIESYLKFLYCYQVFSNSIERVVTVKCTHNLFKLFESLSDSLKEKIVTNLENVSSLEFINYLKTHSLDFIKWRYPSKQQLNADANLINNSIDAIYNVCDYIMRFEIDLSLIDDEEYKQKCLSIRTEDFI